MTAIVIHHIDADGETNYLVAGDVRFFIVDDRAPDDRVYEWLPRNSIDDIEAVMPASSEIGSNVDERHAAIAHTVSAILDGKPRLTVVE